MGYTVQWGRVGDVDEAAYAAALKDIAKIVKNQAKMLSGPFGEEGTLPKTTSGIAFNGVGDDSHETFSLPKTAKQLDRDFCKTNRKPYTAVVMAALARLAEVAGIKVSSDGSVAEEWTDGVALASKVLGRKVNNPLGQPAAIKPSEKKKPELRLVKSFVSKVAANYKVTAYDEDINEGEPEETPMEGDAFLAPSGPLGSRTSLSVDGKHVGEFKSDKEAEEALVKWINKNKHSPSVWYVSDHGNVNPYTLDAEIAKQIKM
jgi:hypothetical protein